jgi:hypothetical protein
MGRIFFLVEGARHTPSLPAATTQVMPARVRAAMAWFTAVELGPLRDMLTTALPVRFFDATSSPTVE